MTENKVLQNTEFYITPIIHNIECCDELALGHDDKERLCKMKQGGARDQFLSGRLLIKEILGPEALQAITTDRFGRPSSSLGPIFNLTHSAGWVGLAVTQATAIGVDMEGLDRDFDFSELAELCLSPYEISLFKKLGADSRRQTVLSVWTQKEAILKALGTGLQIHPNSIETYTGADVSSSFVGGFHLRTFKIAEPQVIVSIASTQPLFTRPSVVTLELPHIFKVRR